MMSRIIAMGSLLNKSAGGKDHQRYSGSYVGREALSGWPAQFEGCQNRIRVDRGAADDFVSQRVRKSIDDRHAACADRRFADPARADRRFRIGDIERGPLHFHRGVENGWRLVVVETLG